jgi:hypothetical protein
LDVLFQSLDCCTFMSYTVFGPGNVVLLSGGVPSPNGLGGGAPPGSVFLGWTSTISDITGILLSESDNNNQNPDNNYGYDSFRFAAPAAQPVPEPGTWLLLGGGLALVANRLRRSRR